MILTAELFKKLCPNAPKSINDAFVNKQKLLVEILSTPERLAMAIANIYAETSGYALDGLTENINYTASRMAAIWPNRFASAAAVEQKFGTAHGWQNKAFDEIYGGRMGNNTTGDGSKYIGRGGPQLTGHDEYDLIGRMIGVDLISAPSRASDPDLQPDILAAYWKSKNFSKYADSGDIVGARKIWNGGTNGLAVVEAQYPKLLKIINSYVPTSAVPTAYVKPQTASVDKDLMAVQHELLDMGYAEIGDYDGLIGGRTIGGIKAFCIDRGIASLQWPDDKEKLFAAINIADQMHFHRPISPGRAFATTDELAPKVASVAPTKNASLLSKITGWFGTVGATSSAVVQFMPNAHDTAAPYLAMAHEYYDKIPGWVPMAVVGAIAFAAVRQANNANKATTTDYQTGKIN